MAAINLKKGQTISLAKAAPTLEQVCVGLGWDEAAKVSKTVTHIKEPGFIGKLLGQQPQEVTRTIRPSTQELDLDASVVMLDNEGNIFDTVYFGNLYSRCNAVTHHGDNLTGSSASSTGKEDDEVIDIELSKLPATCQELYFVVNIYNAHLKSQDFGQVENAYIHILDAQTNTELVRFELDENYAGKLAMIVGKIYKKGTTWEFEAIGRATDDKSINTLRATVKRFAETNK